MNDSTALNTAVYHNNLPIIQRLLSIPGINPGIHTLNIYPTLIIAIREQKMKIINIILDFYGDSIKYETYQLNEAIKIIYDKYKYLTNPSKLNMDIINRILDIKYIDPNFFYVENNENSSDDSNSENDDNKKSEEEEELEEYNQSFLLCACKKNDVDFVKRLLKLDKIDVNIYSNNRVNTPLIVAIKYKFTEIAELIIKHPKTNINHINRLGKTALVYAVENKLTHIFDLLINDKRFDPDESQLNYAFMLSDFSFATKFLYFDCLDVNYVINIEGEYTTKLVNSVESKNINIVDLIINHPSFDKNKSLLKLAIEKSIMIHHFKIFKKLMKCVDNDVNIRCISGNSLLFIAVYYSNNKVVDFILNDDKFDSTKSDILKSFVAIYSKKYHNIYADYQEEEEDDYDEDKYIITSISSEDLEIMEKIFTYDKQHDNLIDFKKLLPNGKSFFTSIECNYANIKHVIHFLIEHGADPNMPDKNDYFPLEHAFELDSYEFALALIDSNKIDFKVKIPKKNCGMHSYDRFSYTCLNENFTTYLHLATKILNNDILLVLLERNLIDVNIIDSLGNTALMETLINKKFRNILYFFKKDDLNYLHRNFDGHDALSIVNEKYYGKDRKLIEDKTEYLEELKKSIEANNLYNFNSEI